MQYASMDRAILRSTENLTRAQRQVSTGRRLDKPSDDPAGATQALGLRAMLSNHEQYVRNTREARLFLNHTEQALGDLHQLTREAREITMRGANDTITGEERATLAGQIDRLTERLMQIANQKVDDERFLFSGQKVRTRPYTESGGTLQFEGDTGALNTTIAQEKSVQMNMTNAPIVELYDRLQQIKANLQAADLVRLSNEDLHAVEAMQNQIQGLRGSIGITLSELERYDTMRESRTEQLTEILAQIEEVDLIEAVSNLRRSELAYEAALQVSARAQNLNLFDYLRGG